MIDKDYRYTSWIDHIYNLHPLVIIALNVLGGIVGIGVSLSMFDFDPAYPLFNMCIGAGIGAINGAILAVTIARCTGIFSTERLSGVAIVWAVTLGLIFEGNILLACGLCLLPFIALVTFLTTLHLPTIAVTLLSWLSIALVFLLLPFIGIDVSLWIKSALAGLIVGIEFVVLLRPPTHRFTAPDGTTRYVLNLNDQIAEDYAQGRLIIGDDGELAESLRDDDPKPDIHKSE